MPLIFAAGAPEAVHQSVLDHVGHCHEHDRDRAGCILGGSGRPDTTRPDEDEIRASRHELLSLDRDLILGVDYAERVPCQRAAPDEADALECRGERLDCLPHGPTERTSPGTEHADLHLPPRGLRLNRQRRKYQA